VTGSRKFPNDVKAIGVARRFALTHMSGYAQELRDVVELLVSELATNSVRHTESGFELKIACEPNRIRVSVTDSGPGRPVVRALDTTSPSGRGLALMKALSSSSGVRRSRSATGGKTVWFVLEVAGQQVQRSSTACEGDRAPALEMAPRLRAPRRISDPELRSWSGRAGRSARAPR
jgi:anti-sigma regulatory factor (Ser/Thr protein kinase)